jgi:Protein of unknown function (Hypoth_ymh)
VDFERVLTHIDQFIQLCEQSIAYERRYSGGYFQAPDWLALQTQINEALPLIEQVAQVVDSRLAARLRSPDQIHSHENQIAAATELRGPINSREEVARAIGPIGPQLSEVSMHPWVWNHAPPYWDNGHRRAAIQKSATAVFDVETPAKLKRARDTNGGRNLMGQAFSTKDPEPGAPRLRLPGYDKGTNEKGWRNAQEGAMYLGMGAAAAIRNLVTHNVGEPPEQEALEMLATLSLVARLVERAVLVEVT